jgi:cytochrome c1
MEAWGWLPPPLAEEGAKVQSAWLTNYLRNPTTIRPAGVLPMPKFNLSEEEVTTIAQFFAASTNSDNNVPLSPKTDQHLDQTLQLVLDSQNFCARCHSVGDYRPDGDGRTNLAPNLADAGSRLQQQYIHRWLADPKTVLPYTPMPQIFPPEGNPQGQEYLPGNSGEQLDAVEQLLLEYGEYAKRKMSIQKMMPPPKPQSSPVNGL